MTIKKDEIMRPEVLDLSLKMWEKHHGYRPRVTARLVNRKVVYTIHLEVEAHVRLLFFALKTYPFMREI